MKTLKFNANLADLILIGKKTVTWRIFDDKDLKVGDLLNLQVKETGKNFAKAEIIHIKEKKLGEITEEDQVGHEPFRNKDEMIKTYKKYYSDKVESDTVVKIIKFKLI